MDTAGTSQHTWSSKRAAGVQLQVSVDSVPANYTLAATAAMCTDHEHTPWNGGIELGPGPNGSWARTSVDSLQMCAERCDGISGCRGFVYWDSGHCRTYRSCADSLCSGCHEYRGSRAYRRGEAEPRPAYLSDPNFVPVGYTELASDGMCTDHNLTAWNQGIEIGPGPQGQWSRWGTQRIKQCAERCNGINGCGGFVY